MQNLLFILQIIVATSLITVILLQAKGSGLSGAFGGQGGFYRSKRGVEKLFIYLTIFLGFSFLVLSLIQVVV
ncbi:MAG: preprotein translocase subunit SecG [Candidatus Curtissbacteria bacterium]|nr:preprotein translocase subunit SecG [Candidatus Curtissbacteria bacterium]